jgi:hypothetical protein
LQALGKQKSARERNKTRDDWKHELEFFSGFFKSKTFGKNFLPRKKTSLILYYTTQEKAQLFFII